jgi:hypothetical protein
MPISLTHPCLDCLALAKVVEKWTSKLYEGRWNNSDALGGLLFDMRAFIKEREP